MRVKNRSITQPRVLPYNTPPPSERRDIWGVRNRIRPYADLSLSASFHYLGSQGDVFLGTHAQASVSVKETFEVGFKPYANVLHTELYRGKRFDRLPSPSGQSLQHIPRNMTLYFQVLCPRNETAGLHGSSPPHETAVLQKG